MESYVRTFQAYKKGKFWQQKWKKIQQKLTKIVWDGFQEFIARCRILSNHAKKT